MTKAEDEQYTKYKTELSNKVRISLEETDSFLQQVCALQYIPWNRSPQTNFPNGTVAYINAKTRSKTVSYTHLTLPTICSV